MILTSKFERRKKCKDGKSRNFVTYFLDGQKILSLKDPFDTDYDLGYDVRTNFSNERVIDNRLYMTKTKGNKIRHVSYPIKRIT